MDAGFPRLLRVIPIWILTGSSLDITEQPSDSLFIFHNSGFSFPKGVVQYIFILAFLWGLGGVVESNIIHSFHASVHSGNAGRLYGGNLDTALGHKGTPAFACCLFCFVTTPRC